MEHAPLFTTKGNSSRGVFEPSPAALDIPWSPGKVPLGRAPGIVLSSRLTGWIITVGAWWIRVLGWIGVCDITHSSKTRSNSWHRLIRLAKGH